MLDVIQPALFSAAELEMATMASAVTAVPGSQKAAPRINKPERYQLRMITESLDQRLDGDHPARTIWRLVREDSI